MPGDTTHTPPASVEASPLPGARAGHCRVGPHRIACLAHNEHLLPVVDEDPDLLPLVFVQGLSMSVRFWEVAMLEPIRRRLPWYSVSLPLHFPCTYDGDPGRAELSTETFGRLLGETIRHLVGERRVRVVGHSVGAFAALAYAADYSHRCDAVMSIGGFTSGRAQGLEGKLQLLTLLGRWGTELTGQTSSGDLTRIDARLLAAHLHDLQHQLPDLTGGEGVLESRFDGYQPVRGRGPTRRR